MKMKIYVIRHGETDVNVENKINASFKEFELENIEPVKNVVNKFIPFEDTDVNENL